MILEASESLDGFQQESDTVVRVFTRSHSLLCVWRGKKEQGDLAGATAGVRAGGLDQGVGSTGGEKLMKP